MTVIVHYVDFHWDNYQGGSGKSFEFTAKLDIPDDLQASCIDNFIYKQMHERIAVQRPFRQDNAVSIKRIEII